MMTNEIEALPLHSILTNGKDKFCYIGMNRTRSMIAVATLESDIIQSWATSDAANWVLYVDELAIAKKQKEEMEAQKAALELENQVIKQEMIDLQAIEALADAIATENEELAAENEALKVENSTLKEEMINLGKDKVILG